MQMQLWRRIFAICSAVAAATVVLPQSAHAGEDVDATLARYIESLAADQDPRVADALNRIDGTGRRLLALRSYVRGCADLADRWSWTNEQIAAYEATPEYGELQQEIARVNEEFARENPGFELWVNPQVRSLDIQLEHWNTNESVAVAAANLQAAASELVTSPTFPAAQPARATKALESFLASYDPVPTPTIAAPGLSLHGQMRSIDFQVHQGGRVVAGPTTSTIDTEWDGAGWSAKLDAAVHAASQRFIGPLASPREPWHYTYSPSTVAAQ
jgi:hypothetical protein